MDAKQEVMDILQKVWTKLQGLPQASSLEQGAFAVLILFVGEYSTGVGKVQSTIVTAHGRRLVMYIKKQNTECVPKAVILPFQLMFHPVLNLTAFCKAGHSK